MRTAPSDKRRLAGVAIGAMTSLLIASLTFTPAWADPLSASQALLAAESPADFGPGYQTDFVTGYLSPTQLYDRITALAAEFPSLAQIVQLPEKTNGYQRPAQGLLGTADASRIGIDSKAAGYLGGNGIVVATQNPGAPDAPLSVSVSGTHVTVGLATDSSGSLSSTAAQVVSALNADPASAALLTAYTFRGNAGGGIAAAGSVALTDGLAAPAEVARGPHSVYALRIGKFRDGTKPGVLLYAQEHGNEWVPPLVTIETAERLLRNYGTDPTITGLVDDLDVWILPSVNPDGGHYSFYDDASHSKNMTRYCPLSGAADSLSRSAWGVDIDRNFTTGSLFDGFNGASIDCTAGNFAGPAELSEPESRNLAWIAGIFPNIDYAMDLQSPGPLLAWSPGAEAAGVTLPRPDAAQEAVFQAAAGRIVAGVESYRGTTIPSSAIGARVDLQPSAAGNSMDYLWYTDGITALTLGVGTETQPPFTNANPSGPSAHAEAQESAAGVIEFLRFARDPRHVDQIAPTVQLTATPSTLEGNAHSLVLEAQDADSGLDVVTGDIYQNGAVVAATHSDAGGAASFTHTIDLATVVSGGLPLGSYELRYSASDVAGNTSATQVFAFTIADTTKPTVTLVSPATAGPFKTLALRVDATDNQGLQQIVANIYRNGVLYRSTQSAAGGAKAASHSATVALPEGNYTLRYSAVDLAGLASPTGVFAFSIDTTAPVVVIKPIVSRLVGIGTYSVVSFAFLDLGKIDRLTLNGVVKDLPNSVLTDLNAIKPGVSGALKGANTLVVYDVAGNARTITFRLS